jgi:transposase InsO family protein
MRQDVPQGRLARWVLELQGTDFTVLHRKGELNRNADALSRAISIQRLCALSVVGQPDAWRERLISAQRDECGDLIRDEGEGGGEYLLQGDLICRRVIIRGQEWFPVVLPPSLRADVLQAYHADPQAGHFGIHLTYEIVRRRYYWRGLKADIVKTVKECEICTLAKQARGKQLGAMGIVQPTKFNQVICIDHVGPLDNSKRSRVLVIMDSLTRWVEVVAVNIISSRTTAQSIQDVWFCRYGAPGAILTDNSTSFKGRPMERLLADWHVIHRLISPYHPQANPVERINAELKRLLRSALLQGESWKGQLQMSAFCLRNRICTSLGISPGELVFGMPMRMPLDLPVDTPDSDISWEAALELDRKSKAMQKNKYDKSRREVHLFFMEAADSKGKPFLTPYGFTVS